MSQTQPFLARWKKVSFPNKLTVGCTLIIAAATVWYSVTAHRQLEAMQGQLSITNQALSDTQRSSAVATDQTWQAIGNINWLARVMDASLQQTQVALAQTHDNFVLDQRAWLGVTEVAAGPIVKSMKFTPILINSGKTLATRVTQRGGWKTFPKGVIPDIDREIKQEPEFFHGVIFPNGRRELSANSDSITADIASELRGGAQVLYVFSEIDYRDAFRKKRTTKFCLMLNPAIDQFSPCPFYVDSAD